MILFLSLFTAETKKDRRVRNQKIREAVMEYGYSQNQIAAHLKMHYSTISRLLSEEKKYQK